MIEKVRIVEFANDWMTNSDKYVVDLQIKPGNIITLVIDGDTPVKIVDCIQLSKFIESNLDREVEDYDLKISSFGAEKPFKLRRQYRKNVGRNVEIITIDDKIISGKLLEVDDNQIKIETSGKKKKDKTISGEHWIDFDQIKQTSCIISFK